MSNGESVAGDGRTISLKSAKYAKGLGVHALSEIHFNLAGRSCSGFQSDIGLDDEVSARGSVVFQIRGNNVNLYDSGVMRGTSPAQNVNVGLAGVTDLALLVNDAGDSIDSDHADWAGARLSCIDSTPPVVTGMAPLAAATGVSRSTPVAVVFSEPMTSASINASTFSLLPNCCGTSVPATVVYDVQTMTATLRPTTQLLAGATYTVTIGAGVRDLAGNPLVAAKTWSFSAGKK